MKRLFVALVAVSACGPRTGPEPNVTYFWRVTASSLEWGQCGDSASLRAGLQPVAIDENSYLIYKVDSKAAKATAQTCSGLNSSTCVDAAANIVFDIAGRELTYTSEAKSTVQNSTCRLQENETWSLFDKGDSMSMDLTSVLSLVDSPVDCPKLEASVKNDSPNTLGIVGCVITRKLSGALR